MLYFNIYDYCPQFVQLCLCTGRTRQFSSGGLDHWLVVVMLKIFHLYFPDQKPFMAVQKSETITGITSLGGGADYNPLL